MPREGPSAAAIVIHGIHVVHAIHSVNGIQGVNGIKGIDNIQSNPASSPSLWNATERGSLPRQPSTDMTVVATLATVVATAAVMVVVFTSSMRKQAAFISLI